LRKDRQHADHDGTQSEDKQYSIEQFHLVYPGQIIHVKGWSGAMLITAI
jgi:hypothetical protein